MTSQVIFKMDTKLKERAMKKARREGLPFSTVLNRMVKAYIDEDYYLELVPKVFNEKTRRELAQSLKEIDRGEGLSPGFTNAKDAIAYLNSL